MTEPLRIFFYDPYERARLLITLDRHADAIRELESARQQRPNDAEGLGLLAICHAQLGRVRDGRRLAREAIAQDPALATAHYALSFVEFHAGNYRRAEAAVREAIRLLPIVADYHGHLAACLIRQHQWAKGEAAARHAITLDPDSQIGLNNRAVALMQLGRYDEADTLLRRLLALQPNYGLGQANLGWNLLHQRQPWLADECFRSALQCDPSLDWAKQGLMQALRCRSWLYRQTWRMLSSVQRWPRRRRFLLVVVFLGVGFVLPAWLDLPPRWYRLWLTTVAGAILTGFVLIYLHLFAIFWANLRILFRKRDRHLLDLGDRVVTVGLLIFAVCLVSVFGYAAWKSIARAVLG